VIMNWIEEKLTTIGIVFGIIGLSAMVVGGAFRHDATIGVGAVFLGLFAVMIIVAAIRDR